MCIPPGCSDYLKFEIKLYKFLITFRHAFKFFFAVTGSFPYFLHSQRHQGKRNRNEGKRSCIIIKIHKLHLEVANFQSGKVQIIMFYKQLNMLLNRISTENSNEIT